MTRDELHKLCIETAAKSPCKKRKVGAVIAVANKTEEGFNYLPIASGYNTSLDNGPCECEQGRTREEVIHAEVAALNRYTEILERAASDVMMFVTHEPCDGCKAALLAADMPYEVVGEFMKFDSQKPRMALVPASLAQSCARALTYGAKKYKPNNWRKTPDIESYISALQRHFDAWREGEEQDPESGLSHLDHIAANLAFIIELKDLPKIKL